MSLEVFQMATQMTTHLLLFSASGTIDKRQFFSLHVEVLHLWYGRTVKFLIFPHHGVMMVQSTLSEFCCSTITIRYCVLSQSNIQCNATQQNKSLLLKATEETNRKFVYYKHILSLLPRRSHLSGMTFFLSVFLLSFFSLINICKGVQII